MIEGPVVEQFYYILKTFLILWLYQQSIKYFTIYEVPETVQQTKCSKKVVIDIWYNTYMIQTFFIIYLSSVAANKNSYQMVQKLI